MLAINTAVDLLGSRTERAVLKISATFEKT
jgi:hypothetical protein